MSLLVDVQGSSPLLINFIVFDILFFSFFFFVVLMKLYMIIIELYKRVVFVFVWTLYAFKLGWT